MGKVWIYHRIDKDHNNYNINLSAFNNKNSASNYLTNQYKTIIDTYKDKRKYNIYPLYKKTSFTIEVDSNKCIMAYNNSYKIINDDLSDLWVYYQLNVYNYNSLGLEKEIKIFDNETDANDYLCNVVKQGSKNLFSSDYWFLDIPVYSFDGSTFMIDTKKGNKLYGGLLHFQQNEFGDYLLVKEGKTYERKIRTRITNKRTN